MSSFEFNKIFAAVLVAGVVAMFAGFIAEQIMHPHPLHKNAVEIEGGPVAGGAVASGPTGPEPILALLAAADIAKGEKLSKACAACHSFDKGGSAKVGPNLWNIVSAPKAHMSGFDYSSAMAEKGGVWGYDDLNHFLWKPKNFVEGTKMNYIGLKKPEDRAAMIAWLRTLSGNPEALPNASEIAAEEAALGGGEGEDAPAGSPVQDDAHADAPAAEGAVSAAEEQAASAH